MCSDCFLKVCQGFDTFTDVRKRSKTICGVQIASELL